MTRLPDTENPMVLPYADDDPIPTPPEDDGGEQRQRDTDAKPKSNDPRYMRGWNFVGTRYGLGE